MILSGRLEVTVGESTRVLGAGDAYYFDSHQPHRFRNVGNVPCTLVSSCSPDVYKRQLLGWREAHVSRWYDYHAPIAG